MIARGATFAIALIVDVDDGKTPLRCANSSSFCGSFMPSHLSALINRRLRNDGSACTQPISSRIGA